MKCQDSDVLFVQTSEIYTDTRIGTLISLHAMILLEDVRIVRPFSLIQPTFVNLCKYASLPPSPPPPEHCLVVAYAMLVWSSEAGSLEPQAG